MLASAPSCIASARHGSHASRDRRDGRRSAQPVGDFLRNMAWKITVLLEDPHEQPGRRGTPDLIVVSRCRPTVGWITLAEHRSFNLRCLGPGPLRRSGPALWDALRLEHDHERAAQFAMGTPRRGGRRTSGTPFPSVATRWWPRICSASPSRLRGLSCWSVSLPCWSASPRQRTNDEAHSACGVRASLGPPDVIRAQKNEPLRGLSGRARRGDHPRLDRGDGGGRLR